MVNRFPFALTAIAVLLCGCSKEVEQPVREVGITAKATNDSKSQIDELNERIMEWKTNRTKLDGLLRTLEKDRLLLLTKVQGMGLTDVGEAVSDPRAKVLIDELRDVLRQQTLFKKKHEDYDLAVFKSESRLRTIERRLAAQDAGVSDAELEDLSRSMIALDESLASENESEIPAELDQLLSEQLATVATPQPATVLPQVNPVFPLAVPMPEAAIGGQMPPESATSKALVPEVTEPSTQSISTNAGWTSLFDGTTLKGWRRYDGLPISHGWIAEDGMLCLRGNGGSIITEQQFDDFELELEWKISPGGNSGILYRVRTGDPQPFHSGPEFQILDNDVPKFGKNPSTCAGAMYGVTGSDPQAAKPAGEFNTTRILVRGNHVEHWLNDKKVLDIEMHGQLWHRLVRQGKFVKWDQFAKATKGHIALQDHGSQVCFRNIRIRKLSAERTTWKSSNGAVFAHLTNDRWQQSGENGRNYDFKESARNAEFVEISGITEQHVRLRLFGDRAMISRHNGEFTKKYAGSWVELPHIAR